MTRCGRGCDDGEDADSLRSGGSEGCVIFATWIGYGAGGMTTSTTALFGRA